MWGTFSFTLSLLRDYKPYFLGDILISARTCLKGQLHQPERLEQRQGKQLFISSYIEDVPLLLACL